MLRRCPVRISWTSLFALLLLPACQSGAQRLPDLTWGRVEITRLGTIERRGLTESSGIVPSTVREGVFWTFEDSGNEPALYAMDSTGRDLGTVRVANAVNEDWEAIAGGPCGDGRCLYIGDVGDNLELRRSRVIYRVREPWADAGPAPDDSTVAARDSLHATVTSDSPHAPAATDSLHAPAAAQATAHAAGLRASGSVTAEVLRFTYEDRPHDVEAMVVSNDGAVHLITKGRRGGVLVFRVAPEAWSSGLGVAVRTDSLRITTPTGRDRITDAALAPDGRLAVRSYRTLYIFRMDPLSGKLVSPSPELACDLGSAGEPQGEGITWLSSGAWLLTSEQRGAPITVVRCTSVDSHAPLTGSGAHPF